MSRLQIAAPLAPHTSWRVGGCADQLYHADNIGDLTQFLSELVPQQPITFLGLGSNVLIRDGGIRGTVILTLKALTDLEQCDDTIVRIGAGVCCAQVARFTARLGLQGAEFLAGIPGTIGGALAMNAGCFGSEIWSWITAVETIDRRGQCRLRSPQEFTIAYRELVSNYQEWFVTAWLTLELGQKEVAMQRIRTMLAQRNQSQPTNLPSCGSVFRNPVGDFAGRLIEASGLGGLTIGDASVSSKHANFIVNQGSATAADIEQLIHHVAAVVLEKQGVALIPEVKIMGEC